MTDAPRPPLPDMDWTEAVEATHRVVVEELVRYGFKPDTATLVADLVDAAAVNAVWPILHAAAQPLDGGR